MGRLVQTASPLSDYLYISGSIWFRIPFAQPLQPEIAPNSTLIDLFEILPQDATSFGDDTSYLTIFYDSDAGQASVTMSFDTDETTFTLDTLSPGFSVPNLAYGQWHHIAFGIDINHAPFIDFDDESFPVIDPLVANVVIDGVNFPVANNAFYPFDPPGPGGINWFFGEPSETYGIAPTPLNNQLVGIPSRFAAGGASVDESDFHPIIELAEYQVWAGTYINFSNPANFSKVVMTQGGRGFPTIPATSAANAFGTPSWAFRGDAGAFTQNRGNGGEFAKVGTINDFTPGPSYG